MASGGGRRMRYPDWAPLHLTQARRPEVLFSLQLTRGQRFFQVVLQQTRFWQIPPDAFADAALRLCRIIGVDFVALQNLVFFHSHGLLIWKDRLSEAKQIDTF